MSFPSSSCSQYVNLSAQLTEIEQEVANLENWGTWDTFQLQDIECKLSEIRERFQDESREMFEQAERIQATIDTMQNYSVPFGTMTIIEEDPLPPLELPYMGLLRPSIPLAPPVIVEKTKSIKKRSMGFRALSKIIFRLVKRNDLELINLIRDYKGPLESHRMLPEFEEIYPIVIEKHIASGIERSEDLLRVILIHTTILTCINRLGVAARNMRATAAEERTQYVGLLYILKAIDAKDLKRKDYEKLYNELCLRFPLPQNAPM